VGANPTLSIVLGYASGFPYKDGEVNSAGTFLLAVIASQTRKQAFIEHQLILKAQKSIFNRHPWRERRVIFGDRTYTGTLTAL
jgi:hypothetical protein